MNWADLPRVKLIQNLQQMPRNFEGSADFYKCERGSVRGGISVLPTPFAVTLCAADCPKVCNKGHAYPASLLTSLVDNNSKTLQGRDKAFHDSCCLPDGQVVNYLPDGQVVNYVPVGQVNFGGKLQQHLLSSDAPFICDCTTIHRRLQHTKHLSTFSWRR